MKFLRISSLLLLTGLFVFSLESCSKPKTEVDENTTVNAMNTGLANTSVQMDTLMSIMGIGVSE